MALIGPMSGSHTALTDGSPAFITSDTDIVKVGIGETIVQRTQYVDKAAFGDKSDGSPALDTVNTYASWATLSAGTYTMIRDAFFDNLTLTNTAILLPNGFMPYIAGTLTIAAGCSMENRGNAAVTTVAGTAQTTRGTWYSDSSAGGAGASNTGNAAGNPGGTVTPNGVGGAGGAGGSTASGIGGLGGSVASPAATATPWRVLNMLLAQRLYISAGPAVLKSASGGGSGGITGGGSSGVSGGGGGGAMNLYFIANVLNNAGTIRSIGGNGGNASFTGPATAGGGGGGGGGIVLCAINSVTALGTIVSTGGTGGSGANGGNNGNIGVSGQVVILTGSI